MDRPKQGKLLQVKFPQGHRMGSCAIPLMLLADYDFVHFEENCAPQCDEHGIVLNRDEFLENLQKFKPAIAKTINDIINEDGPAIMVQIWREPLCFYQTCPI